MKSDFEDFYKLPERRLLHTRDNMTQSRWINRWGGNGNGGNANVFTFASLQAARANTSAPEGSLGIIPTGNVRMVEGTWVPEFVYRMGAPVTVGTLSGKVLPSAEGWTHLEDGPENITTDGTHVRLWTDNAVERAQVTMDHTETGFRYLWCDMLHRTAATHSTRASNSHVTMRDGVNAYTASTRMDNGGRWGCFTGPAGTLPQGAIVQEVLRPSIAVERRVTIIADTAFETNRIYLDGMLVAAIGGNLDSAARLKQINVGDGSTDGTLDWYLRSLAWGVA